MRMDRWGRLFLMIVLTPLCAVAGQDAEEVEQCLAWKQGTRLEFRAEQCAASDPACHNRAAATSTSLGTWKKVLDACGSLTLVEGSPTTERVVGYTVNSAGNQNIIVTRLAMCSPTRATGAQQDCWSHDKETIAVTTTTYRKATGEIVDADIELNGASQVLSTVDSPPCASGAESPSCVAADVQNTLTHELGHALGLMHSDDPASTMFAHASPGETGKRTVDAVTAGLICARYSRTGPSDCDTMSQSQSALKTAEVLGSAPGCAAAGGPVEMGALLLLALSRAFRRRERRAVND